jgi:hypothetical protein
MEGTELMPSPAVPLLFTDTRSVLGWMENSTEPVAVLPVLSLTVNVAVEFPSAVGMPLTTPVPALRDKPAGKRPVNKVHVKGAVPPVVANVAE